MLCISDCIKDLPVNIEALCEVSTREGGINRLIVAQCDVKFDNDNPVTDWEVWKTFQEAGKVMLSPELSSGEKPETEDIQERLSTCGVEETTQETHIISGQSKSADKANLRDFDFWDDLRKNIKTYLIGYVGCDGLVYIDLEKSKPGYNMRGKINYIMPENNDNLSYFMFNLRWKKSGIIKGVKVDNFMEAFATATS